MRFLLQMGHGMMNMNLELLGNFGDGEDSGVIAWARTLTPEQAERHSEEVRQMGGSILFDSCFYMPHTSREKILSFPYWRGIDFGTADFAGGAGADFCRNVIDYQVNTLHVTKVLLPGRYADVRNEEWLEMHALFAETARSMDLDVPVYSTIALGPDVIRDLPSFEGILNEIVTYPVDGLYFLYRPPDSQYLTNDDLFLANLLTGFLSISLAGKEIILGYANQQALISAAAGVETIATGNFRNVRSFDPAIFEEEDDLEMRRGIWYYDGNTFCEFRLQQLGLAYQRLGLAGHFGPVSQYSAEMLQSANPATYRWQEPLAFKHFITVLRDQWLALGEPPPNQRHILSSQLVQAAKDNIRGLQSHGLVLTDRALEASSALDALESALGSFDAIERTLSLL